MPDKPILDPSQPGFDRGKAIKYIASNLCGWKPPLNIEAAPDYYSFSERWRLEEALEKFVFETAFWKRVSIEAETVGEIEGKRIVTYKVILECYFSRHILSHVYEKKNFALILALEELRRLEEK